MFDTTTLVGVVIRGVGGKKRGKKRGEWPFGRWQNWTKEEEGISYFLEFLLL